MEEALYDTSVLIELQKGGAKEVKGCTTILNIVEYPKALRIAGLRVIYPDARDYALALKISKDLYKSGKPVPAVDIVLAAVAINRGLRLLTEDRHFEYIKEIRKDLLLEIAPSPRDTQPGKLRRKETELVENQQRGIRA